MVNVAVSCGSGYLTDHDALGHEVQLSQLVVTGDVKVIQLFQPQSPLFQVIADIFHDADHAHIISWKSTYDATIDQFTVYVTGTHHDED